MKPRSISWWALLVLLVISNLFTFYWYAGRGAVLIPKGKYPLLDPAQSIYQKDDLIVDFQPLRERLRVAYENHSDYLISLYFEYLPTGANIVVNKDAELWPASLLKIPVAMVAMKKVETGAWKLSNELVLLENDRNADFGDLYKRPVGTRFTIEELIHRSLIDSDNTTHFILLRNIDETELADVYDHLGIEEYRAKGDSRVTAKRYSVFFRSLYTASYYNDPAYAEQLLDILSESTFKDFLSAGLPASVKFAHKVGIQEEKLTYADSGIVYEKGRPYILTVMMAGKHPGAGREEAAKLMKEISAIVHKYVSEYR